MPLFRCFLGTIGPVQLGRALFGTSRLGFWAPLLSVCLDTLPVVPPAAACCSVPSARSLGTRVTPPPAAPEGPSRKGAQPWGSVSRSWREALFPCDHQILFFTCPLSHFCTVSLRFAPLIFFFSFLIFSVASGLIWRIFAALSGDYGRGFTAMARTGL